MPLPKPVDNFMRPPCPTLSSKGRQSGSSFGTFAHKFEEDERTQKPKRKGLDVDDEAATRGSMHNPTDGDDTMISVRSFKPQCIPC